MSEPRPRLHSLDALRGFDMLWIVGGSELLGALARATGWGPLRFLSHQTEHVEWHGFTLWDLVFPLFLFLAGVSMPYSLGRRLEAGAAPASLYPKVLKRGALLVLFGAIYNGLLTFDLENQRWASVLGRIGLAWSGAALVFLHTRTRGRVLWIVALLVGYWAALRFVPVPGFGAGNLEPGKTLADHVDRLLLPGRLHRGDRDPEGLASTVPAIATALLGALAGQWLRREVSERRKVLGLVIAGAVALSLGGLWSLDFPLNKNLWSSSFVLWTAGLSALLLALFYGVVDVLGMRRLAWPFEVFGCNAITIYLLDRFVDFDGLAALVFDERRLHGVLLLALALLLRWGLVYQLHRRRIFLRV